jgi:hypothetical protein
MTVKFNNINTNTNYSDDSYKIIKTEIHTSSPKVINNQKYY